MQAITDFLISHGGLILFGAAFLEQSGLPFPGALWLVGAGALAASGKFSLFAAIGWTTAGCIAADVVWFILGHRGKAYVFKTFPYLESVQANLQHATIASSVLHGTRMLTVAKFVPLGNLIPLHAGAMKVDRIRFLLVDAFCSAIYAAVFTSLGFAFHNQLEQVVVALRQFGSAALVCIVLLAVGYLVYAHRKHRRSNHAEKLERGDDHERACTNDSP